MVYVPGYRQAQEKSLCYSHSLKPYHTENKKNSANPPYKKLLIGVALCTNWEDVGFVPSSSHCTNCFFHWPKS